MTISDARNSIAPGATERRRATPVGKSVRNIVLVDDSKTVALAVKNFFKGHDFDVFVPQTFVQIPALLKEHMPVAVILDLNMPSLSGEQVGQYLRRNNYHGPVIIYSSESSTKLASAAEKVGAFAFISKDCPLQSLLDAVQSALKASAISA